MIQKNHIADGPRISVSPREDKLITAIREATLAHHRMGSILIAMPDGLSGEMFVELEQQLLIFLHRVFDVKSIGE